MKYIKKYLLTTPILATLWFGSLADFLIEINQFFLDALSFPFYF